MCKQKLVFYEGTEDTFYVSQETKEKSVKYLEAHIKKRTTVTQTTKTLSKRFLQSQYRTRTTKALSKRCLQSQHGVGLLVEPKELEQDLEG
jgi:hypothetical protein